MSFQSFHFLVFVIALFVVSRIVKDRLDARKNLLLGASYYFYMCWDWRFAGILLLMTAINYLAAQRIHHAQSKRTRNLWLGVAVGLSLGILGYFKYVNFFLQSFQSLMASLGMNVNVGLVQMLMPIGISFFTFQSLSYVLDVHKGREGLADSFRDFALFVAFFPTVLSGPITRSRQLLPQFAVPLPDSAARLDEGLFLVVRGFVKKVAFADVLATQIVDPAFAAPGDYSTLFLLVAVYGYSFQLYMDLSGYTDIARGVAKLLGFELPENFNRPYLARTVSSFWQRWHMSMSGFFRDYLFHAVGGSKTGNVYVNLYITFIAIGFWHGAGWNFILYGFIHGTIVAIERWRRGHRARKGLPPESAVAFVALAEIFITFNLVAFSRILFRAPDISVAGRFVEAIWSTTSQVTPLTSLGLIVLVAAVVLHYLPSTVYQTFEARCSRATAVVSALGIASIATVLIALSTGSAAFIYFRF